MSNLGLMLAAGGVGAAYLASEGKLPFVGSEQKPPESTPRSRSGARIRDRVGPPNTQVNIDRLGGYYDSREVVRNHQGGLSNEELNAAIARAKAEFEALPGKAKEAGCAALKRQFPNEPAIQEIPCDADFDQLVTAVATALGTAVGGAIGGPIGAAVGTVVGAYLGRALGDYLSDAWDEVQDWASDTWDDVKDWFPDLW